MFRNNLNNIYYKNFMKKYEEDKKKTKLSDTKLGKYFNSLSVKKQRKLLKKMNEE